MATRSEFSLPLRRNPEGIALTIFPMYIPKVNGTREQSRRRHTGEPYL